ncbi:MAG: PAS domain S-box protein [Spirochaetales bacterium]|nr:PAS domain S-box protein [Spirochaetales bacterium]
MKNIKVESQNQLWSDIAIEQRHSIMTMVLQQSNQAVTILDKNGNVIYANSKFLNAGNKVIHEVIGKNWRSFVSVHSDLNKNSRDIHEIVFKEGKVWRGDVRNMTPSGEQIWQRVVITPIKDQRGSTDFIVYSSEDITKNKLAEIRLIENEKRFQLALENASEGLFDWNMKTGEAYFNQRYFVMLGYESDELAQNADAWIGLLHPEDKTLVDKTVEEYLSGKRKKHEITYRMRTKQGNWRWVVSRGGVVEWDAENNPVRMIGTHVDITDKIKAEESLKRSEALFRTTIESIPFDFFVLDKNQCYIIQNRVSRENWGDIIGKCPEIVAENEATLSLWKENNRKVLAGETIEGEVVVRVKGENRYFYNIISPIFDEESVTGILGINIDITDYKMMEDQLHHSEKMEAIGQLAGGIAHDFNNQLTGIMGYTDFIRYFNSNNPETITNSEAIKDIVQRAAALTSQLLAFARKGKFQSAPVDLHVIIKEVGDILFRSINKNIRIKQRLEALLPITLGDSSQIENALLNIAINARDAMEKGGELSFSTESVILTQNTLPHYHDQILPGSYVKITITDTGSGIESKVLSHLFEPFFTTKPPGKGTGMGLAAVYGTIQMHHGGINVYSKVGEGTSFELFFPVHTKKNNEKQQKQTSMPVEGEGRILYIEDEDAIRLATTQNLESLGYSVIACSTGDQAIEDYSENINKFDLMILDIVLPGIDGISVYQSMITFNPEIKVLFCSGYSPNDDIQQLMNQKNIGFIHKPYTIALLSGQIAEMLNQ